MTSELYDRDYYEHDCGGVSYLQDTHWVPFFGNVANQLIALTGCHTVLDAGCALGYLVEAFRARGVEAWGVDISEYAIANLRPGARGWCWRQDLADPVFGVYDLGVHDLVTCIEVLEHVPARQADAVIGALCRAGDDIIFTSSPSDLAEPTHVNVQPAAYWVEHFERHGFARDETFDGSFICPWAMRFRRR